MPLDLINLCKICNDAMIPISGDKGSLIDTSHQVAEFFDCQIYSKRIRATAESTSTYSGVEISMSMVDVYVELWDYLRSHGLQTIEVAEKADAWDYRISSNEYSVRETFHHTVQAIFEDAGNWFLNDSTLFRPTNSPIDDLHRAIDRMISAIQGFLDADLNSEFTFQWGEKTTISGAIRQNLFHAVGHFSQLRNWVGVYRRSESKTADKTCL